MFTKKEFCLYVKIRDYLKCSDLQDIIVHRECCELRFLFENNHNTYMTREHHNLDGSELYQFIKKIFEGKWFEYNKYKIIDCMHEGEVVHIFEIIQNKSFRIDINTTCIY